MCCAFSNPRSTVAIYYYKYRIYNLVCTLHSATYMFPEVLGLADYWNVGWINQAITSFLPLASRSPTFMDDSYLNLTALVSSSDYSVLLHACTEPVNLDEKSFNLLLTFRLCNLVFQLLLPSSTYFEKRLANCFVTVHLCPIQVCQPIARITVGWSLSRPSDR